METMKIKNGIFRALAAVSLTVISGCAVLVGQVEPPDEKATTYQYLDLSQENDWEKLDPPSSNGPEDKPRSDVVFQSKSTGAIISLNSVCRAFEETRSLQELSNLLVMSVSEPKNRMDEPTTFKGESALLTLLDGKLETQGVRIKTLVTKNKRCIFDFMYIASQRAFPKNEKTFESFLAAFKFEQ